MQGIFGADCPSEAPSAAPSISMSPSTSMSPTATFSMSVGSLSKLQHLKTLHLVKVDFEEDDPECYPILYKSIETLGLSPQ